MAGPRRHRHQAAVLSRRRHATCGLAPKSRRSCSDPEVPRRPDWAAIDALFTFAYVPAPATGFEGIRQLLPGHWLLVQSGRVDMQRWFRLPYPRRPHELERADESVDRLDTAVRQAVSRQMISDVPLGHAAERRVGFGRRVAGRCRQRRRLPVSAFTIGFDGTDV